MIKKIDITKPELAREVLNVQISSYKIEAELLEFDEIPPLKDTVETIPQGRKATGTGISPACLPGRKQMAQELPFRRAGHSNRRNPLE